MIPPEIVRPAVTGALLAALAVAGCATSGAVPRPFPGAPASPAGRTEPAAPPAVAPPAIAGDAAAIVETALALKGTPYRDGGSDPESGFDCSGLVQWVFARHGTILPRETRDQYAAGIEVDADDVRPGDLVFFETISDGPSHVGIALGDGSFVHAPSSRGVVRVESYRQSPYWARRWVGARRIVLSPRAVQ